jgi:diguanylate cyclase (GGDEF)-like protein
MPERWTIQLLQLRRHEKDYILRGSVLYVNKLDAGLAQLRGEIENSSLPKRQRNDVLGRLHAYQTLFHQYVDVANEIEADSNVYLSAVHTVEPMLEHLRARMDSKASATLSILYERNQATMLTFTAATVGAVSLGLIVAAFILRSIARPLEECVTFAGRMADGDLSARLQSVQGKDFTMLILSMNQMADRLQQAAQWREMHEVELQRLNRALRVLSLCNETLVRATSESKLLETICNHIVDVGGYRLAWVGYARDEEQRVEPIAHAGTAPVPISSAQQHWAAESLWQGTPAIDLPDTLDAGPSGGDVDPGPGRIGARIAVPLRARDRMLGVLAIYAEQEDAFDTEEVKVLQELADDLAFGIAGLRESAERKRFEQELERQANFDALTGLANRFTLEARLTQSVSDAQRSDSKLVTMFIDLDRFKGVNDTLGHAAGDTLLVEVARRLESAVRDADTVARVGGDEFVVVMKDIHAASDAAAVAVAGKIIALMAHPVIIEGQEINPSASIGISIFPDDGDDGSGAQALLRNADLAMYDAKTLGGAGFRFYAPEMNARMAARVAMETDLRHALAHGELLMHYQPQLSLVSGTITAAEALVRWCHPQKGMISPQEFIPLAEETGLILPLGEWILRNVCAQLRTWLDAGVPVPPVAVNLSARQFRQDGLVGLVRDVLAEQRLEASMLHLEITESVIMHDVDSAVAALQGLKALGVGISLDDFGTGYSSLSYLKRFPIDHLKIDQSFVRDITCAPDDAAICNAIISLAHHLQLSVVAEGVETDAQLHYLRRQRCDLIQGYRISKPLGAADFARFLEAPLKLPARIANDGQNTLLIVDDEVRIVRALQRTLLRDGYHILTAQSAAQALDLLASHDVQVILCDQRMPGMSGTEFLSRAKDIYPDTIRLMLTGYAELDSVLDAINRGAIFRFFTKPWDDESIRRHIREAFRHHKLTRQATDEMVPMLLNG